MNPLDAERKRKRLEAWRKRQQNAQQLQQTTYNNNEIPLTPLPKTPAVKMSLSLNTLATKKLKHNKNKKTAVDKAALSQPFRPLNPFGTVDDDSDDDGDESNEEEEYNDEGDGRRKKREGKIGLGFMTFLDDNKDVHTGHKNNGNDNSNSDVNTTMEIKINITKTEGEKTVKRPTKRRRKGRWDSVDIKSTPSEKGHDRKEEEKAVSDALDKFMEKLDAGALGSVATQIRASDTDKTEMLSIDVGGSMMRVPKLFNKNPQQPPLSGGIITSEQIANLSMSSSSASAKISKLSKIKQVNSEALYTPSDWESGAGTADEADETDDDDKSINNTDIKELEEEEKSRRAFIEALKIATEMDDDGVDDDDDDHNGNKDEDKKPLLAAEVKNEKFRREQKFKNLEREAETARSRAEKLAAPEYGRLYNDLEGGIMEEAERNLDAAMAAPDALEVLAELNKKKELKSVDHSEVDYIPFKKNLFIVPRALAKLTSHEIANLKGKLKIRVRGRGAPAPVSSFEQCGLSERIMKVMEKQCIRNPFPVQAQCIPCIMAGRDVIGVAPTGSGKTLAYLLPMLRHILDQPPLEPHESGPIGLVLAPARELTYQIHLVCKSFTKPLGLKSTAVYGGTSIASQIADLKRGTHIVVATPGRLIDILTMQAGKLLSLQRVTYVVMDEGDRMYDMGFAPQISAILAAVRPDRQTVLFSATFPKTVEKQARNSLKYPLEIIVGGRSVASDNVVQYAELVEEEDKFFRLLQLLGENVDEAKKVIIFVDTQVRADNLFEQLLRNGYVSLSLHGGKEQEDRDSTISDFRRRDGPGVLVATGVAGRGLDVPSCVCVINYSCPNHLEAYVHQVGRTGRAKSKGVAYTIVNSADEAKFAPNIVRALTEAGQSENISSELKALSDSFKEKVQKGEAKWAGSGFKGRGYTYDKSEMSEAQKVAQSEKRQALIEAGLLDPDDEDHFPDKSNDTDDSLNNDNVEANSSDADKALELHAKLTPELLALPGMKDAILRRAGIAKEAEENDPSLGRPVQMGQNHFLQEFEINDYPREARWKVTQKETTTRLQDEFQTAVTLKGVYFSPQQAPEEGKRRLYLHLEATSERVLQNSVVEIKRLLNEETLRVGAKASSGSSSHKYSVLGK